MKVVQINCTILAGSTGRIAYDLSEVIVEKGNECAFVCGYRNKQIKSDEVIYLEKLPADVADRKNMLISRITGRMGYRNKRETQKAIKWIEAQNPDVIHLHNIHGDWIHLETLFNYLANARIPVIWTLHDCWAFTGRCSHFEQIGCSKWKKECFDCRNKKVYPITYLLDESKKMYADKKNWFTSVDKMVLVTPSNWLANYVKQSYLSKYEVITIHNGVDTSAFLPHKEVQQNIKQKEKRVILGVCSSWSKTKGLDDFIKLDELIDHEKYKIVMVGLKRNQITELPKTIEGLERTNSVEELALLYSNAYVFFNPTYQDNFPTVNIEALSCGTPVITYDTGGSPESINEEVGIVLRQGDIQGVYNSLSKVENICHEECRKHAIKLFDKYQRYGDYIELYEKVVK
ncbi:MAG: glycosyltransferase [Lachnospiraceae bacterium]|nr:glycosyltransferase [Lachnospiraceae bacterium]